MAWIVTLPTNTHVRKSKSHAKDCERSSWKIPKDTVPQQPSSLLSETELLIPCRLPNLTSSHKRHGHSKNTAAGKEPDCFAISHTPHTCPFANGLAIQPENRKTQHTHCQLHSLREVLGFVIFLWWVCMMKYLSTCCVLIVLLCTSMCHKHQVLRIHYCLERSAITFHMSHETSKLFILIKFKIKEG